MDYTPFIGITRYWLYPLRYTTYPCMCECSVASVVSDSLWPLDLSLQSSSVHGILQARILSGLPCPPPGDLPETGIEPVSPAVKADSLPLSHWGSHNISLEFIYFIHSSWCFLVPYPHLAPSLSPLVTISLFSISVNLFVIVTGLLSF